MNPVHVHLVVNHVPIAATWLALPLLALALWRLPNRDTWLSALVLLVVAAGAAGATLLTGQAAEEAIEGRPGISDARLEEHEERGVGGAAVAVATGVAALGAWALGRRAPVPAICATLAVAVASGSVLAWVGYSGGLIRHPELLDEAPVAPTR
ncbi:MAG: hypothetical protein Q8P18_06085 [Pseudomonadota bacterium]|nr:hypothetical protein [Pseudomonadota bacterium]